jgi:hypothetical protein
VLSYVQSWKFKLSWEKTDAMLGRERIAEETIMPLNVGRPARSLAARAATTLQPLIGRYSFGPLE